MKQLWSMIKNDFKNYRKYHFLSIILLISVLFGFLMAYGRLFPPIIYIYISVFILPVISYSVTLVIAAQQGDLYVSDSDISPHYFAFGKMLSALIVQLIPLLIYIIVFLLALNYSFNLLAFILIYILSSMMHIMIGLSLSMIAKSSFSLSMSYLVYIIVFSIIPIFYSLGFLESKLINYILIISPAYLSGVIFESIIHQFHAVETWFVYVAVILQLVYIGLLYMFVVKPFIDSYLRHNH